VCAVRFCYYCKFGVIIVCLLYITAVRYKGHG